MTLRAGVIGWPIAHSRSPLIHGSWIAEHQLDASYDAIPVDPSDAPAWLANFSDHGLVGINVTLPHKEAALAACSVVEPHAQRLGAVNTLWLESGRLHGTSTDGAGFMSNLAEKAPNWQSHAKADTALILGAGGAARAIVDALIVAGVSRVIILNRTLDRASALVDHFMAHFPEATLVADTPAAFPAYAQDTGLLVNTTALGMEGKPPLQQPLDSLANGATVSDIVYTPLQTDLLKEAQERHHPTVDGLGMLLHQATPGFERWFGIKPVVSEVLRQRIIDDL